MGTGYGIFRSSSLAELGSTTTASLSGGVVEVQAYTDKSSAAAVNGAGADSQSQQPADEPDNEANMMRKMMKRSNMKMMASKTRKGTAQGPAAVLSTSQTLSAPTFCKNGERLLPL